MHGRKEAKEGTYLAHIEPELEHRGRPEHVQHGMGKGGGAAEGEEVKHKGVPFFFERFFLPFGNVEFNIH